MRKEDAVDCDGGNEDEACHVDDYHERVKALVRLNPNHVVLRNENRGAQVAEHELDDKQRLDLRAHEVLVRLEFDVQDCGERRDRGAEPQLHRRPGLDEDDHRREQQLANQVNGLKVPVRRPV